MAAVSFRRKLAMSSDRLTGLPEEIVSHILSLMPTKYAVRTSVLSKSWRYTWTNVNNLNFDDIHRTHGEEIFTKFVDQVLKLRKTSQLRLFQLHVSEFRVKVSSVSSWINEAVKLNVNELDIQVMKLGLPLSMFTSKTLTKLRILSHPFDTYDWEFSCQVNLPCLKTLDVAIYSNPCVSAFKLIRGCPVLENLFLKVICFNIEDDYQFNIPTLKQLKVTWLANSKLVKNVVLNVPNLEYLFVRGELCPVFEMKDVSSLVEASISFNQIRSYHPWVEVIKRLVGVKSLSVKIRSSLIYLKTMVTSPLPVFRNLNHLELKELWHTGLIFPFLESSPELKHLCIEKEVEPFFEDPKEYSWVEPKLVPACMLTKLTYIKFSPGLWWKRDLPFLKYMLGNAKVLKTVTITLENLLVKDLIQLFEELPKFPRASRCCEIHYHG